MMTIDTSLHNNRRPHPSPNAEGIKPTILKVEADFPKNVAVKQINKNKPLPPMPATETSTATRNEPAPGSKSDPVTAEFRGDVGVSDELPTKEMMDKAADIPIVDADGKEMRFKSLYQPPQDGGDKEERRTLVIFIRHFFCGSCQDYIRFLSESIPPSSLPPSTSLVIVGCGSHTLIKMYADETSCPYPIYANPTRSLYDIFGMIRTMNPGSQPDYIKGSLPSYVVKGIMQALRRVGAGDVLKAGDAKQVGGEFLFTTGGEGEEGTDAKVTWCHRMKNTRGHSLIPEIKKVLGVSNEAEAEAEAEAEGNNPSA